MSDTLYKLGFVRSALFMPASNARALEKARGLDVDMLILDLEDAVPPDAKVEARAAAIAYARQGVPGKLLAIRVNCLGTEWFDSDVDAVNECGADFIVLPKVEDIAAIEQLTSLVETPLLVMIETPLGIYNAREIAAHKGVAGLIAGTNDIAAETGIRPGLRREGLELALQSIVLAGAASGKPCFDGVNNNLDDMDGFFAECGQGACYGFAGKTLIHPNQIAAANRAFGVDEKTVAEAEELITASRGGAQRFKGRMIEAMHVEQAKLTIERAKRATDG